MPDAEKDAAVQSPLVVLNPGSFQQVRITNGSISLTYGEETILGLYASATGVTYDSGIVLRSNVGLQRQITLNCEKLNKLIEMADFIDRHFTERDGNLILKSPTVPQAGLVGTHEDGVVIKDDDSGGRLVLRNSGSQSHIESIAPDNSQGTVVIHRGA